MVDHTKNRLKLAFLLFIAFVPITLATLAYRNAVENGGFVSTVNKGNLIMPPADITDLAMTDVSGAPLFKSFEEIIAEIESDDDYIPQPWMMVYVTATTCDAVCEERVHLLRQMHITLNEDMPRVRRYYLNATGDELPAKTAEFFKQEFQSMGIAQGNKQTILDNLAAKNIVLDLENNSYVFFVDPVGNVMMYYEPQHPIQDIKTDLEKLLGLSSLG